MVKVALIRIRGEIGLDKQIKRTLKLLHLYKKHVCSIVDNTDDYVGMLKKVKDYITWGELDKDTFKLLLEKRGKLMKKQQLEEKYLKEKTGFNVEQFASEFISGKQDLKNVPGLKQFFRLMPPKGGFERGGIKKSFAMGGALGYRKEKINELIKKMI